MLALSTAYLGWSVLAQQHVRGVLEASLRHNGMAASQMLVTPAPIQHRAVACCGHGAGALPRGVLLLAGWHAPRCMDIPSARRRSAPADNPHVQRLSWFSHGFMRMQANNQGRLTITDLRMGLEPCYSFHFDIGPAHFPASETGPVVQQWQRPDLSMALPWLWRRLTDPTAGTLSSVQGGISCGTTP